MDEAGVDFAFVAWHDEGRWSLTTAPAAAADSLGELMQYARRLQGESGSVAFVSVADEFFVCLRIQGTKTRVLLSDVTAALDWPIADEAADLLGVDVDDLEELSEEEADDGDRVEPAGDLTLLADLGLPPADLDLLCRDPDLYPEEQVAAIAERVGFAKELASLVDAAPA